MVHRFMDNSADESQIGTLTGLLVRCFLLCAVWSAVCPESSAHWPGPAPSFQLASIQDDLCVFQALQSCRVLQARDAVKNLLLRSKV